MASNSDRNRTFTRLCSCHWSSLEATSWLLPDFPCSSVLEKMLLYTILAAVSMATGSLAKKGQATNFDLGSKVASQYGCPIICQAILEATNQEDLEVVGTSFDFNFDGTSPKLAGSARGDVLKLEPFDANNLNMPDSIAAFRMQYTSVDIDSSIVPATTFIAFPFARPASGKFQLIAYAHGTIGLNRGCAPSSGPSLFDYNTWTTLLLHGYAVVATDYVGLGTNYTSHKYLSLAAHADDIYWSVKAAHQAFPKALSNGSCWASRGHGRSGELPARGHGLVSMPYYIIKRGRKRTSVTRSYRSIMPPSTLKGSAVHSRERNFCSHQANSSFTGNVSKYRQISSNISGSGTSFSRDACGW